MKVYNTANNKSHQISVKPFKICAGTIQLKDVLPVTRVNFGGTILGSSSGQYKLGRLHCAGQNSVSGMPTSCQDLWFVGHTTSGFYSVKSASQLATVFCDFSKLPNDPGNPTIASLYQSPYICTYRFPDHDWPG